MTHLDDMQLEIDEIDDYQVEHPRNAKAIVYIAAVIFHAVCGVIHLHDKYEDMIDEMKSWGRKEKSIFFTCLMIKLACSARIAIAIGEYREPPVEEPVPIVEGIEKGCEPDCDKPIEFYMEMLPDLFN